MNQYAEFIDVEIIDYDLSNPRIAHIFEENPESVPSPDEMARALRDESSESLRKSIKKTDGIKNPIKIMPADGGRYRVFEGNTRLSIYRAFKKNGTPGNWKEIPAVIYTDIDQPGIDEILIQDHIVGTQPWSAYAKARYIFLLHTMKDYSPEDIAAICGIGVTEIFNAIKTYRFMNDHYRKIVDTEELSGPSVDPFFTERRYTAFLEYTKNDTGSKAVDLAGFTDSDFSRWIAKGLFSRNEDVRYLPAILENEAARKTFLKYGSKEAKKLLDTPTISAQLREATMLSLCQAVIEKANKIESREIRTITENQTSSMLVYDAIAELQSFYDVHIEEK